MTENDFLIALEESGYFKYTDANKIQAVKDGLLDNLKAEKEFMTAFNLDEDGFQAEAMDMRFYNCGDCEELLFPRRVSDSFVH